VSKKDFEIIGDHIGRGAYGRVYRVKRNGKNYAMKEI
jgi:RIO-like serine/threonine protein kinase